MAGKYLTRRKFYIPIKESCRYYASPPRNVNNYLFSSDYREDDPVSTEDSNGR